MPGLQHRDLPSSQLGREVALIDLREMSEAQAAEFAELWRAQRAGRLRWLARELSISADGTVPSDLVAAWSWYLDWQHDPRTGGEEPVPVWWMDSNHDTFSRDAAKGLDACFQLFEECLVTAVPALVQRILTPRDREKPKLRNLHENKPVVVLERNGRVIYEYSVLHVMGVLGARFSSPQPRQERLLFDFYVREVENTQRILE
jgi:hypothetical protein